MKTSLGDQMNPKIGVIYPILTMTPIKVDEPGRFMWSPSPRAAHVIQVIHACRSNTFGIREDGTSYSQPKPWP